MLIQVWVTQGQCLQTGLPKRQMPKQGAVDSSRPFVAVLSSCLLSSLVAASARHLWKPVPAITHFGFRRLWTKTARDVCRPALRPFPCSCEFMGCSPPQPGVRQGLSSAGGGVPGFNQALQ